MYKKVCTKCEIEKELDYFSKDKTCKFEVKNICKNCCNDYNKEYYKVNLEKEKERIKKHYENNKEILLAKQKEYYENNPKKRKEKSEKYYKNNIQNIKEYWENNKEEIKQKRKEFKENNPEKVKEYTKRWRKKNPNYYKEYQQNNKEKINLRQKEKKVSDYLFKLKCNMRSLISVSFKNKGFKKDTKTANVLGCDWNILKTHIESQFESWMSWDNYGKYNGELNYGWDIDHIIPLASAKTVNEVVKLNHYTNLQPLCCKINREVKRDIILNKAILDTSRCLL